MRRSARLLVLLVVLMFASAGPAAAYYKNTSAQDVWVTMGAWGAWGDFFADWQVQSYSNGTGTLKAFQTTSVIRNGNSCSDQWCTEWVEKATVTLIRANGTVYTSFNPPYGLCFDNIVGNNDRYWVRCRTADIDLPANVTKVKIRWVVTGWRHDGHAFAWVAEKTVPV